MGGFTAILLKSFKDETLSTQRSSMTGCGPLVNRKNRPLKNISMRRKWGFYITETQPDIQGNGSIYTDVNISEEPR